MGEQKLKQMFFAQYLGCKFEEAGLIYESLELSDLKNCDCVLVLKNISNITDDDASLLLNTRTETYISASDFSSLFRKMGFLTQQEADVLRTKGYLVPFMNLSVEEIIKKGWAKYE